MTPAAQQPEPEVQRLAIIIEGKNELFGLTGHYQEVCSLCSKYHTKIISSNRTRTRTRPHTPAPEPWCYPGCKLVSDAKAEAARTATLATLDEMIGWQSINIEIYGEQKDIKVVDSDRLLKKLQSLRQEAQQ